MARGSRIHPARSVLGLGACNQSIWFMKSAPPDISSAVRHVPSFYSILMPDIFLHIQRISYNVSHLRSIVSRDQIRGVVSWVPSEPWHIQKAYMSYYKKKKRDPGLARDFALDAVLERESKIKYILLLKEVLQQQEMHVMDMQSVGKLKKLLGFKRKRKVPPYVKRFPGIFKVTKDEDEVHWLEFSDQMEDLLEEEAKIMREHHEPYLVTVVRKLLMMSPERKLNLINFGHIKRSFGFPDDFKTNFVYKYPEYFHVIPGDDGLYLELASWDPELAVSVREKKLQNLKKELGEDGAEISPHSFTIMVKKGFTPPQKVLDRLEAFQALPFPSPYDHDNIPAHPTSPESLKRLIGMAHEFLSLTLEKKAILDHFSHFRKEFRLPGRIEELLDRYPFIFYVSPKGDRHTAFLREAYKGEILLDRSPLLAIKDRIYDLWKIRRGQDKARSRAAAALGSETVGNVEEDNDLSDEDEDESDDDEDNDHDEDTEDENSGLEDSELDDDNEELKKRSADT